MWVVEITSQHERRDVARRLRELDHEITSYDTIENGVNKLKKAVHGNTSFSPIEYSVRNLCGLANVLADLIDPTCEIKKDNPYMSDFDFICKSCGEHFSTSGEPRYCPNCGRKVIPMKIYDRAVE